MRPEVRGGAPYGREREVLVRGIRAPIPRSDVGIGCVDRWDSRRIRPQGLVVVLADRRRRGKLHLRLELESVAGDYARE